MILVASLRKAGVGLTLAVLALLGVLLPLHQVAAQTPRLNPSRDAISGPLPSLDEGVANIERQDRLRGRASRPRERSQEGVLEQVPDAVRLGIIEPPKEMRPR